MSINCQPQIPEAGLTVGDQFVLVCDGPWPEMDSQNAQLQCPDCPEYSIKLLKFNFVSKTSAELFVTSFKTGEHDLKTLQVVSGDQIVPLENVKYTVKSVIDPKEPPAEPFGPFGPILISVPLIYWIVLAAIISAIGSFVGIKIYRRNQRKKLLLAMRLNESVQTPVAQFYAALRKMQRQYAFFSGTEGSREDIENSLNQLDQMYRFYVARKFLVPTQVWSDRLILADIKKHHKKFFTDNEKELRKSLAELSRARKNAQTNAKDVQQIVEVVRRAVESMEKSQ
jgi:hypothetical protein